LGRRDLFLYRNPVQQINRGVVRRPRLWCKARNDVAEVGLVECRVLVDLPGEKAFSAVSKNVTPRVTADRISEIASCLFAAGP
jgi:hypothetical protein